MTISTTDRAAELLTRFETATADLAAIRKTDLSFLRGAQLSDPHYEVIISNAEATSFDIDHENREFDGTIGLRVGVRLKFKPTKGVILEDEDAVLWIVTDGRDVEISLSEIVGAEGIDFVLSDVEKILSRLGDSRKAS